jgi:hypothetical protein
MPRSGKILKMALSPAKFKERIANAKRNADIKAVIESTGAQPVTANTAKGEYIYHAPYREDTDPSLKINVHLQKFIDYGLSGSEGDVIELTRRIFGKGDINAMPFLKAVEWLERFSGTSVAPKAIQAIQGAEKRPSGPLLETDRYSLVKTALISAKTHPSNLAYITEVRRISLPLAKRYLKIVTYKDNAAPSDDPLKGFRYGVGGENDSGGIEVRAASMHSNFKTSLGPKDVSSFDGHPRATAGDIFEGRFDFLTRLEIAGETVNYNPTVVLNSGRLAARAAQTIRNRADWQHITHWRIWQHNDDEGHRTTQTLIEELGEGYTVGTVEHLYEGFNDLNECWTKAEPHRRSALSAQVSAYKRQIENSYSQHQKLQPDAGLKPR